MKNGNRDGKFLILLLATSWTLVGLNEELVLLAKAVSKYPL
jgi:hypothetical protein